MSSGKFGAKGEWWVVAQFVLLPIALLADYYARGSLVVAPFVRYLLVGVSILCLAAGALFAFGGVLGLGRNLTAVPHPINDGHMVQTGLYALVRHPIYAGIIFGTFGMALLFASLAGIVMAALILVFFDRKSRREEAWLTEKYAGYADYRLRVRKLIPFVY